MKHVIIITGILFSTIGSVETYRIMSNGPCSKNCGSVSSCLSGDSYIENGWTQCEITSRGCEVYGGFCNNNGGIPQME